MTDSYKEFFILLFALCFCYGSDWPCFRGNPQRTGYSAEQVGVPVGRPLWQYSLGCKVVSSPSVVDSLVYIGGRDSCFYALDIKSGEVRWKQKVKAWVDCSPLVYKGVVIVGSRDGKIYGFDRSTGDSICTWDGGLQLSSPVMFGDTTILMGLGHPMNGFGAYSWGRPVVNWFVPFAQISYSSPAVMSDMAVSADNSGQFYGINLSGRTIPWTMSTVGGTYLSSPCIEDSVVYFAPGNADWDIYKVGLRSGRLIWKKSGATTDKRLVLAKALRSQISPERFLELLRLNPVYRQRVIGYFATQGIVVPNLLAKRLVWAADSGKDSLDIWNFYAFGDMKTSSVAVGGKNVYVIHKELGYPKFRFSLIALDKETGKEEWFFSELRNSTKFGYCSSPVVAGNNVYFGWGEGRVYAFNAASGKQKWSDRLDGDIISSPAVANGKLYFATYNGSIYAYDLMATADPLSFQDGTYCYPNPAKSVSYIQYFTEKAGAVEGRIYDGGERLVKVFRSGGVGARTKGKFSWELSSVSNGVFFGIITASYSDGTRDRKIIKIAVLK